MAIGKNVVSNIGNIAVIITIAILAAQIRRDLNSQQKDVARLQGQSESLTSVFGTALNYTNAMTGQASALQERTTVLQNLLTTINLGELVTLLSALQATNASIAAKIAVFKAEIETTKVDGLAALLASQISASAAINASATTASTNLQAVISSAAIQIPALNASSVASIQAATVASLESLKAFNTSALAQQAVLLASTESAKSATVQVQADIAANLTNWTTSLSNLQTDVSSTSLGFFYYATPTTITTALGQAYLPITAYSRKVFDTLPVGSFNNSTGTFTCPKSGIWSIMAGGGNMVYTTITSVITIHINDTIDAWIGSTGGAEANNLSRLFRLTQGDQLRVHIEVRSTTPAVIGIASPANVYQFAFQAHFVTKVDP